MALGNFKTGLNFTGFFFLYCSFIVLIYFAFNLHHVVIKVEPWGTSTDLQLVFVSTLTFDGHRFTLNKVEAFGLAHNFDSGEFLGDSCHKQGFYAVFGVNRLV